MIHNQVTVEEWADAVSSLSDSRFFDIMRLYLGEIETPYNKQRLIEQLAGFIKNQKNAASMVCLLDEFDVKILSALYLIPNATQETLIEFFASEYTMTDLYAEVSNLIERLLVFEQKDKYSSKRYLKINPLIFEKLLPRLGVENIISPAEKVKSSLEDVFSISAEFIAAFISFVNMKGCSCKSDGEIKKNYLPKIQAVFSDKKEIFRLLLQAFINLNLVREGEKSYEIDFDRLKLFAKLLPVEQYVLLCAASCLRFSREGLKRQAQLLMDTFGSIPPEGYTLASITRLGFLTGASNTNSTEEKGGSRFSKMLNAARNEGFVEPELAGSILERMLDSAVKFGLIQKTGYDSEGKEIFECAPILKTEQASDPGKNLLNIDSIFSVRIMPGLPLKTLLPLVQFLEIKSFGVVCEYEITRASVSAAFDNGWTVEQIVQTLEQYTDYELPQNLKISLTEWYEAYNSATLYQGYVLKVAGKNIALVENNPKIKQYIKEKLAQGIYLLNVPVDSDISLFQEESGLDFMGHVKNPFVEGEKLAFPVLRTGRMHYLEALRQAQGPVKVDFSAAGHLLSSLKEELNKMEITKNQRESLENRIRNRLILSKEQLAVTSIRSEILEAEGMDFNGKLHLFEAGLKENDMMEITMPSFDDENQYFKIIGRTLGITKQSGDAVVRFQVYPGAEITNFVVSRITYLRRLRY